MCALARFCRACKWWFSQRRTQNVSKRDASPGRGFRCSSRDRAICKSGRLLPVSSGTCEPPVIDRLIEISLRNRFLVVALWIGIAGWGLWAMLHAPIDAIPDLSDNHVIVFTHPPA